MKNQDIIIDEGYDIDMCPTEVNERMYHLIQSIREEFEDEETI